MKIVTMSPLSGPYIHDDVTLKVTIYQDDVHGDDWTLSVTAPDGTENVFGLGYATEHAAYEELKTEIAKYGVSCFFTRPMPPIR